MFTRGDGPSPWPFVAVNLMIGLSCALPLYLYMANRASDGIGASPTLPE